MANNPIKIKCGLTSYRNPPTKRKVLLRLTLYGPIMVPSMFFAFRDLAGAEAEVAGGAFGILMGILLTALMASHRDRTG